MAPTPRPTFGKHYTSLRGRIFFRWVDIQKKSKIDQVVGDADSLRILDLGCGTGKLLAHHATTHVVFGVDDDPEILTLAASAGISRCLGSFEDLPFGSSVFDVVVLADSLEHVDSRERTALEVRRVLKTDGTLVVITPCYSSVLWVLGERFANGIMRVPGSGHISPFTRESIHFFVSRYFVEREVGTLNFGMWLYAIASKPETEAS